MHPSMWSAQFLDEALERVATQLRTSPAQEAAERMVMQLRTSPAQEAAERMAMQLRTSPAQEALDRMVMQLRSAPWYQALEWTVGALPTDGPTCASSVADMASTRQARTAISVDDKVVKSPRVPTTSRPRQPRQGRVARLERRVARLEAELEVWEGCWFLTQLDAPHPEDDK